MHLRALGDLLRRFNVQHRLGVHLIHRHDLIGAGNVMYGKKLSTMRGCWTKPTRFEDIDLNNIHGHIYRLSPEGNFEPYEYREGAPNLQDVDPAFFQEFAIYLKLQGIENLLGLQHLGDNGSSQMCEFVMLENGTVMLDTEHIRDWVSYRTTGYIADNNGNTDLKGNEQHAATTKGPHKVFIDGKLRNEEELINNLKLKNILV